MWSSDLSFYLFLLSFSLSELAALFDMAAYFRKYPPNHYVITFHRQEPSPFMGTSGSVTAVAGSGAGNGGGGTLSTTNNSNHVIQHTPLTSTSYHTDSLGSRSNHHHHNSYSHSNSSNTNTYPNSNYSQHLLQHGGMHHHHHTYSQNYNTPQSGSNSAATTLTSKSHIGAAAAPDLCNDYIMNSNDQMIDLTLHHATMGVGVGQTASLRHHSTMRMSNTAAGGGGVGVDESSNGGNASAAAMPLPPPQSFMNPEVTITTIERNNGYGTLRNNSKPPGGGAEIGRAHV